MKKLLYAVLLSMISGVVALHAGDNKAIAATTMDYLDIVMCSPITRQLGYYPLEQYEKEIKNLADAGFKKVYIRNCVGLTFYDTKVRAKYHRKNGAHFYWIPNEASWVEKTCEMYDPLKETIRLCHKYGMEAWAWENYHEEVASLCVDTDPDAVAAGNMYALCDPFYRNHPEYLAMIRPSKENPNPETAPMINEYVKDKRVGKIIITADRYPAAEPSLVKKENISLMVSYDNLSYRPYSGNFEVSHVKGDKHQVITIDKMDAAGRYFKIIPVKPEAEKSKYTLPFISKEAGLRAFDTDGKELPLQWGSTLIRSDSQSKDDGNGVLLVDFRRQQFLWDNDSAVIGFGIGYPRPYGKSFLRGTAELHIPAVMEHRLNAFAELAAYDFDGFCFTSRTHSCYSGFNVDEYGFNPEVREKFMIRYGEDIWDPDFKNVKKLQEFRAEALDEYLAQCKKIAGKRPIYAAVPKISPSVQAKYGNLSSWCHLGSMPYNYEKWVKNGSVDGLIMHGWCDPAEFMALKKRYGIKISLFHKVKSHLLLKPDTRLAHMKDILNLEGLDELEMYESCLISDHPQHLQIIRQAIDSKEAVPGGNNAALKRIQEQLNKFIWQ